MKQIEIGGHKIGDNAPVFIIAEIGINHNGKVSIAKALIDLAVETGCNAVKFQKRTIDVVYSQAELVKAREFPTDVVQNALDRGVLPAEAVARLKANIKNTTNGDLKYALEFSLDEYKEINQYCQDKGILCFWSCWDEKSVDDVDQFNPPCYKIASASLTDTNLLKYIKSKGRPIILSTGLSTTEQVKKAVEILGADDLMIMHCVSTYPTADEDVNLRHILTLAETYPNIPIGYSGHEHGTTISVCATAMGAVSVERHITLDRTMWGSDQSASLEPAGLKQMVTNIRRIEKALGTGVKKVLDAEKPIIEKLRRKTDF